MSQREQDSGRYSPQKWEKRRVDPVWNPYQLALRRYYRPMMAHRRSNGQKSNGLTFRILPTAELPAKGVCVTETDTIYLAAELFVGVSPSDIVSGAFIQKAPRIHFVVTHELMHRIHSTDQWRRWVLGIEPKFRSIAIQAEEFRIESRGQRGGHMGSPTDVEAFHAGMDDIIAREAVESGAAGEDAFDGSATRAKASSLLLLVTGRCVGGSATESTPFVRKIVKRLQEVLGNDDYIKAEDLLGIAATVTTSERLDSWARQWHEFIAELESLDDSEPDEPEPDEPDDGDGEDSEGDESEDGEGEQSEDGEGQGQPDDNPWDDKGDESDDDSDSGDGDGSEDESEEGSEDGSDESEDESEGEDGDASDEGSEDDTEPSEDDGDGSGGAGKGDDSDEDAEASTEGGGGKTPFDDLFEEAERIADEKKKELDPVTESYVLRQVAGRRRESRAASEARRARKKEARSLWERGGRK